MKNENIGTNITNETIYSTNVHEEENVSSEVLTDNQIDATMSASDIQSGEAELVLMQPLDETASVNSTVECFEGMAARISKNVFYSGCITSETLRLYYKFETIDSGTYTIHTLGDVNLSGTLYDNNGTKMEYSESSPNDNNNFRIKAYLNCNSTYYIEVASQENDTGCFSVRVADKILVDKVMLPETYSMNVGETLNLSNIAAIYPSNATNKNVNFTCTDSSVASVTQSANCDNNGIITYTAILNAIAPGVVTVKAFDFDGYGQFGECNITIKDYCGGTNYRDVTQHNLSLQEDGYYVCSDCGYKVASPALQDRNILNDEDYLKVMGCWAALAYYEAVYTEIPSLCVEWLYYVIDQIRSKSQYSSQYEYAGSNGKYLSKFSKDEIITMFAQKLNKTEELIEIMISDEGPFEVDYESITFLNKGNYDGFFDFAKGVLELVIPPELSTFLMVPKACLSVLSVLTEEDICEGIVSILSVLADCAKYPELSIILNLILVGATSTGEIENIQIGDHVVVLKVPVESTTDIYMCMCEEVHVFFTESMELKGIIVGIE